LEYLEPAGVTTEQASITDDFACTLNSNLNVASLSAGNLHQNRHGEGPRVRWASDINQTRLPSLSLPVPFKTLSVSLLAVNSSGGDESAHRNAANSTPRLDSSTQAESFEDLPTYNYTGLSYQGIPSWITGNAVKTRLISCYFQNVSQWCEITDSCQHFSAVFGHLVLKSRPVGTSALALASKFLENTADQHLGMSAHLYDDARISLLDRGLPDHLYTTLLAVVNLCVYCMMSMEPAEALLQLQDCIDIFQVNGWNGSSGGLPAACFWAFARLGECIPAPNGRLLTKIQTHG
jgi:hypothetical protein